MDRVIITAALTGAQQGKVANPNLPEQPAEIIQQAVACWRAGAAVVHIHARDAAGRPTSDVAVFREIAEGITSQCDAVLNLSTGGAVAGIPLQERLQVVPALRPEITSFSVGSTMVGRYDAASGSWTRDFTLVQSYRDLEQIARTLLDAGTRPELEIYDAAMVNNVLILREMGLLRDPLYVNLVMGIPGQTTRPSVKNLLHLVESLPPGTVWLATGIGRWQFPMAAAALVMDGHVRVGLEDNVYVARGVLARDNAQLVEKAVRLAREIGREPAAPAEARQILHLTPRAPGGLP